MTGDWELTEQNTLLESQNSKTEIIVEDGVMTETYTEQARKFG